MPEPVYTLTQGVLLARMIVTMIAAQFTTALFNTAEVGGTVVLVAGAIAVMGVIAVISMLTVVVLLAPTLI